MKRTILLVVLSALLLAACSSSGSTATHAVKMAPVSMLSPEAQKAPAKVREAYQFAVANPDSLRQVPCYCGCGSMGHTSNLSCYVKEFKPDGSPVFDNHALGCSLCVDIARDVMNMQEQGKTFPDIRVQIVSTYSSFGPPNQ